MKKIACLGSEAFTLGFGLAGIRIFYRPEDNLLDTIEKIKKEKEIGIVIVEQELLEKLESHDRISIEDMVEPVFVPVSRESKSDNLRKLIIRSIGVDLWRD
ncbi:hypothetical protein J4401_06920 [Candidatus Woesearchaeota archaeon]|nr:hypothetical protein [Candidatus Woesearchaeota archaeon]